MPGGSCRGRPEHAVGEKAGVQPGYVVPRGLQDRHHDRAQIALMPGDQYSHSRLSLTAVPAHARQPRM